MVTLGGGGGGGFWTLAVLPPHPTNKESIAAAKRKRIHRWVATADLLGLSCIIVIVLAFIVLAFAGSRF
jgi:hypothetical protein